MLKKFALIILTIALLAACTNTTKTTKALSIDSVRKPTVAKQNGVPVPLTDSVELVKHLDSLPKAVFPRNVSDWNRGTPNIYLAPFKKKRLFKLLYKLVPRSIGGAGIDMSYGIDSTFNLCDTNYRANWFLITKTPKFFVVEVDANYLLLVTIDYHLNVIDAIHIAAGDPSSNNHFQGELSSTIYQSLRIVMHYRYDVQTDEKGDFDTTNEDDIWRINKKGVFKPVRYTKPE